MNPSARLTGTQGQEPKRHTVRGQALPRQQGAGVVFAAAGQEGCRRSKAARSPGEADTRGLLCCAGLQDGRRTQFHSTAGSRAE